MSDLLKNHLFSDLYIAIGSDSPAIVKGLRPSDDPWNWKQKGLQAVPDNLLCDVRQLGALIQEHSDKEQGMREFTLQHGGVMYRCSMIAAPEGKFSMSRPESPDLVQKHWCVRHLSDQIPCLDKIGMPENIAQDIIKARRDRGLVMVSGSFASGKTTTASSVLSDWVEREAEIGVALEDPPEMPLARITGDRGAIYQINLTEKPIHTAIKHARRWSPRYVFLGEIRTAETAIELLQMAISGPLVICTIHSADPIQAIIALCRFASRTMDEQTAREMVAASLKMVLHQEIIAGAPKMQLVEVSGRENFGLRNKIETGQFQKLYEEVSRQQINRQKAV